MSLLHPHDTPAPAGPIPAASSQPPPAQADAPLAPPDPRRRVAGTRTGRVWVAVCGATLVTVALIIFMIQNTHTVQVSFLGMTGSTSLALMLLIAAVGGVLLTVILGSARIIQLRHAVRRRRK